MKDRSRIPNSKFQILNSKSPPARRPLARSAPPVRVERAPSTRQLLITIYSLSLSACVGLFALAVYVYTLAPGVTWMHNGADSGDLVAAALTLGIPHPPGYPLFTLIGALFTRLPGIEPAQAVALAAALAGALADFFLARTGAILASARVSETYAALLGAVAALGFAFSPALWSQATLAQVYSLNLLFASIILWAMVSGNRYRVYFAAAAFGLGMAHHLSILLLAPGALLALRPRVRGGKSLVLVLAPLLLYAYLPLRAMADPAVNWGDPRTLDRLMWVVSAAPYRPDFSNPSLPDIFARGQYVAELLLWQFTPFGLALALWGLVRLALTRPRLAVAFELNGALGLGYAILYGARDSFIYLLPAFAIVLLCLLYGAADVASMLASRQRVDGIRGRGILWRGWQILVLLALAALPAHQLKTNWAAMDLSADRQAYDFARGILAGTPRDMVIFADSDQDYFALAYSQASTPENSDALVVSQGLLQFEWYYGNLRRAMPDLTFLPPGVKTDYHSRAVEIARVTFSAGRAVCFTRSSPLLAEFEYEPRGDLQCVRGPKVNQ